jgi:hypothetical protein
MPKTAEELKAMQAAGETLTAEEMEILKAGETPEQDDEGLTPEQIKRNWLEAQKRIKELNRESAERRKKLEAFEKEAEDRKNADLSDAEKAKAELAKISPEVERLRNENRKLLLEGKFEKAARKLKLEFANETAQGVAYSLLDQEIVGDDGAGMEKALEAIIKENAYLVNNRMANPETDARPKGKVNGEQLNADILAKKRAEYGSL